MIADNANDFIRALEEKDFPANRAKLESWGFRIHSTELDELEKAGGCLRCMVAKKF